MVFKKILVANRGEIAVRVMRTAREMGIQTVAIYSDLDRNAQHVRLADEAFALGGQTAAESYLNTDMVLEILRRSEADALHPGYGFFSENTEFARAITATGVTFIGPPPEAIEVMGDKISSRIAAAQAGVQGVPGTNTVLQGADEIIAFGKEFGWPVAIKAAYGGGGRGMRVVHGPADAAEALESAQREAEKAFGRSECYVERYLTWPRHIEMQIIGDSHDTMLWLGERDCSSQRRHQKLIEESPAIHFPDEVRVRMGEAAVQVARRCGYVNAGTVEFLYQDGEFYFLEMNTRLQVEHPVTELVTGLDLVELQIRVANGEPLPLRQEEIAHRGAAIEVRINAEDPSHGRFLPSPGVITQFTRPDGPGVRTDAGYEAGDVISQYYDNLIAKVVVWAETREKAIERMVRALRETTVEGVQTTIPADLQILSHPDFRSGSHSTKWVEERSGLESLAPSPTPLMTETVDEVAVPTTIAAEVDGRLVEVKLYLPQQMPGALSGVGPLQQGPTAARRRSSTKTNSRSGGASGSDKVTVPMQGTVVKVLVEVGQSIEVGQSVLILEAMKMENSILAERSGTIKELRVEAGDSVGTGDVVAIIE
ncbi:MAG: acetyl-CoA carboxylase biotin carboxylase subunit [Acidimicrobiales bacterium]